MAGGDSSNDDQAEENAGESETKEAEKKIKRETGDKMGNDAVLEEPLAPAEGMESEREEGDDSTEISFPDTTISLSHLQPSRLLCHEGRSSNTLN